VVSESSFVTQADRLEIALIGIRRSLRGWEVNEV
jgi:hypothetical protein